MHILNIYFFFEVLLFQTAQSPKKTKNTLPLALSDDTVATYPAIKKGNWVLSNVTPTVESILFNWSIFSCRWIHIYCSHEVLEGEYGHFWK